MVTLQGVRLLGLDPGLRFTGWGVIDVDGNRLRHVGDGVIATDSAEPIKASASKIFKPAAA